MRKIILLFSTLIILLFIVYGSMVTFSESREYGRISLDYYLLTPKELSQLSKHCEDDPRFFYSAADGPKPAIAHLQCFLEEKIIRDYTNQNHFERTSDSQFKRGSIEIEFEKNDIGKIMLITVYEYS